MLSGCFFYHYAQYLLKKIYTNQVELLRLREGCLPGL